MEDHIMQRNDTVYTITDQDIAAATEEMTGRRGLRPDRRPSASMRGSGAGGANVLTAATLSMFFCGAGQIYNRQNQLGVLMLLRSEERRVGEECGVRWL